MMTVDEWYSQLPSQRAECVEEILNSPRFGFSESFSEALRVVPFVLVKFVQLANHQRLTKEATNSRQLIDPERVLHELRADPVVSNHVVRYAPVMLFHNACDPSSLAKLVELLFPDEFTGLFRQRRRAHAAEETA